MRTPIQKRAQRRRFGILVDGPRGVRLCEWDVVGHEAWVHSVVPGHVRLQGTEKHVHIRFAIRCARNNKGHVQVADASFYLRRLLHGQRCHATQ